MTAATGVASSARRQYPRVKASERVKQRDDGEENFETFRARTVPTIDDIKEDHVQDKSTDHLRNETQYMSSHVSIAPPAQKLELTLRDTRSRPLPDSLAKTTGREILDGPLRSSNRQGNAPPGHPSDEFYDSTRLPPQPVPDFTQKLETDFLETIESSLSSQQLEPALWDQYAKRAEELLITMPLERTLRALKAFVMARHRGLDLYNRIGAELAREVTGASSIRLCQVFHWLARAGLRDQTLMSLMGNEALFRLSDDFVLDMYVEVLNVHAKLDIRNPRLTTAIQRELVPLFGEFSKDQCAAVLPLTVMGVLSDEARIAYLVRCAELNMGLPVQMTKPEVLRQFRLLEDCLRLDYHPTALPQAVQLWLQNLQSESEAHDALDPIPLTAVEADILRILREEMDVAVTPALQDGILSLHLVMGKTVLEVLDSYEDYYVTPAMGGQRLVRSETKLRQRLLWRRGWRLTTLDADEWWKLGDDLFKKDLLEDLLANGQRSIRQ